MASTKQSQALGMANQLLQLAAQFQGLWAAVTAFNQQNTDVSPLTIWDALPTAVLNADGSLGTADATPNPAHPIDTRVAAVSALARAVAANDLSNLLTLLGDFNKFMTNQTVTTGNRIGVVDLVIGS